MFGDPACPFLYAAKLFSKSGVSDSEVVVRSLALKQPVLGNAIDPDRQRTRHQEELGTFPLCSLDRCPLFIVIRV